MHGFDVRQALNEIVKFIIFGMPRPVGSFFFFLDFDLKLFGLKKEKKTNTK